MSNPKCDSRSSPTPSPTYNNPYELTNDERKERATFTSQVQAQRAQAIARLRAKTGRTPEEDQELMKLVAESGRRPSAAAS